MRYVDHVSSGRLIVKRESNQYSIINRMVRMYSKMRVTVVSVLNQTLPHEDIWKPGGISSQQQQQM
jgi:hypothetical protein